MWWPGTGPSLRPSSPSGRCTTGPSTTSACTSSPASWPSSSPTSCACRPPAPGCACPSANCSASSAASARRSCSTTATAAGPEPTACSPRPPPSRTKSPPPSASPPTPPDAEVGNTRKPPPAPWLTSINSQPEPQISETRASARTWSWVVASTSSGSSTLRAVSSGGSAVMCRCPLAAARSVPPRRGACVGFFALAERNARGEQPPVVVLTPHHQQHDEAEEQPDAVDQWRITVGRGRERDERVHQRVDQGAGRDQREEHVQDDVEFRPPLPEVVREYRHVGHDVDEQHRHDQHQAIDQQERLVRADPGADAQPGDQGKGKLHQDRVRRCLEPGVNLRQR